MSGLVSELSESMASVHLHAALVRQGNQLSYTAARIINNCIYVMPCTCRARANEVADAVRKLDTRVLSSAEEARAILACAPAAEERKMFEAFLHSGGKPEALSDAERFCLELMQVGDLLSLTVVDAGLPAESSHKTCRCAHGYLIVSEMQVYYIVPVGYKGCCIDPMCAIAVSARHHSWGL